jgi:DNA-binding NtrC family response regulator
MKQDNILIIDDNKDILDALAMILGSALKDPVIQTAVNRKKAEEILRNDPIDLIMADLDMPLAEGYALIDFLKKNYPDIPLCVMTGGCSPGTKERLRSMGVERSIEKPFQIDALKTLLREMMKKKLVSHD